MTLARFQMCIGGEWVDALSGKTFESLNPALAEPWAELPDADEADVERAVQAAQSAFDSPAWRGLTATARGKLLRRLGDLIAENKEQLAQLESRDNGKLIRETRGQVGYLPEFFHYTAGLADKLEGGTLPLDKPDLFAYTVHEAMGVVAAIIPWNSPLYLTAIKLAPALAAGNTIVIKPSEHASATILELARLALEAGIPPGVVNVVTGYGPSTGAALTRHPLVRKIAFTGGAATARHVVRSSAENFAKLSLELGGKSPNIIFADADLDSAINGAIAGIYAASGSELCRRFASVGAGRNLRRIRQLAWWNAPSASASATRRKTAAKWARWPPRSNWPWSKAWWPMPLPKARVCAPAASVRRISAKAGSTSRPCSNATATR